MASSFRTLKRFLSQDECTKLKEIANQISSKGAWVEGRQHTRYYKHAIPNSTVIVKEQLGQLINRSLRCILPSSIINNHTQRQTIAAESQDSGSSFVPEGIEWDCYILRYPAGAHIPLHLDELPAGDPDRVHRRLNAIVTPAESGGLFQCETDGNHIETLNPSEGDAVIFSPGLMKHGVSSIDNGERIVWSVGCVTSAQQMQKEAAELPNPRVALIIGAGEVGKQLYRVLQNFGWRCEFVRRNDVEGWKKATSCDLDNELGPGSIVLRILAMREDDLLPALKMFPEDFLHKDKIVLVQNGLLEAIIDPKMLKSLTRGLIYFTTKGDFFSILTDSPFWGRHGALLANSLNHGGILSRRISSEVEFMEQMVIKAIWNSIVGLPLHVHRISLGEYIQTQADEIKAIIAESCAVCSFEYAEFGLKFDRDAIWKLFIDTTKHLLWMKRSGKAVGLSARNGAIQKWGRKHNIPTPITDQLLSANESL